MAGKRCNKVETARRTDQVAQLLVDGYTTTKIVKYCEQKWGLKWRQANSYIAKARKQIGNEVSQDFKDKLNLAIRTRRDRYNEARRRVQAIWNGDLPEHRKLYFVNIYEKQASDELTHIEKLEGLLVNKVDHTSGGEKIFTQPAQIVFQNPDDGEDDPSES